VLQPSRRSTRSAQALVAAAVALVLAACGAAGASSDPTWVPASTIPPVAMPTPVPQSPGSGAPSTSPGQVPPSPGSSTPSKQDSNVVATNLAAPTGLALLPDGTALVGERTTGRIVIVQPTAGQPVTPAKTLTGLDFTDGGGLLDLALSATYSQDGLVLALITTKTDMRVVHFTLNGPVTPLLVGIPRGVTNNGGRLLVQSDGTILIGTGDAGKPALAVDPKSLAGKVLRVDDIGQPATGNPTADSPVFTSGHQVVDGLCTDATSATETPVYETEQDPAGSIVNTLVAGASYAAGTSGQMLAATVAGVGGCAVNGNQIYFAALGGQDVLSATIDSKGKIGALTSQLKKKYGRIITVVADPDGSLWATTSNRDGSGKPVAADERVIHFKPSGGGGGQSPA
jgi:glucose/arabinose dehydrogenase